MYYLVDIYDEKDFERLRKLCDGKTYSNRILVNIKNNIYFVSQMKPINAEKFDITIEGNNHKLSNISINKFETNRDNLDYSGIFSKVNNLYVHNLNVEYAYVYGKVKCGTLAGEIKSDLLLNNSSFDDIIVNSEAFAGGIAGRANSVTLYDSYVSTNVYGHDVIGGVVGLTNRYIENNSLVNTNGIAIGKACGNEAGYCDFKLKK